MQSNPKTEQQARRPSTIDLVLGVFLMGIAVMSGLFVDTQRAGVLAPSGWWQWVLLLTPPGLLVFRRTHPLIIAPLAAIAQMAIWMLDLPDVFLAMIILLYSVAAEGGERGRRMAIAAGVALTAMTAVGVAVAEDVTVPQLPLAGLSFAVAIVLGANASRQRVQAGEMATDLAVSRLRQKAERERSVAEERQRIARELHDIVGHNLSVIAVHAEAADRVSGHRPETAIEAVGAIAQTARGALGEMRQVLGGLREDGEMELSPTPALGSIGSLVDDLRSAGIDVSFRNDISEDGVVPATVAAGVYRIVQEALTNVLKHAGPGVQVEVELSNSSNGVDVWIKDNGRGSQARLEATRPGFGLMGMAERADVLGGLFNAGPRPGGGFAVHATIPMPDLPARNCASTQATNP